jgi:hypothetical protein
MGMGTLALSSLLLAGMGLCSGYYVLISVSALVYGGWVMLGLKAISDIANGSGSVATAFGWLGVSATAFYIALSMYEIRPEGLGIVALGFASLVLASRVYDVTFRKLRGLR